MEVKWIEYKTKKILYIDYRGAKTGNDMINIMQQGIEIMKNQDSKVLLISNFSNTFATKEFMNKLQKAGKEVGNKKIDKSASIGIIGIKKILFKAFIAFTGQDNSKLFDHEEEAKDWLVS